MYSTKIEEVGHRAYVKAQEELKGLLDCEKIPRQKIFTYFFVLFCTVTLFYFYSYPVKWENLQNLIQQESAESRNTSFHKYNHFMEDDFDEDFNKMFPKTLGKNKTAKIGSTMMSSNPEIQKSKITESMTYKTSKSIEELSPGNIFSSLFHRRKTTPASEKTPVEVTSDASESSTIESVPAVPKGFLVFSNHCRIPDLDPMHPSIKEYVEISPPLDCKKGHEPLTRTEGNTLVLDTKLARSRAKGRYSCCWRSVFRENEGKTDNEVGFGKVCAKFNHTVEIKDDFIKVECRHLNRTVFYTEYHSFIHDKPEVEGRCKKHKTPDYSIMIIGIDALSRLNMHRQLVKTYRYLVENMKAMEMYGFNKVGDNTFPNLVPLLLGYDERELPEICWKSNRDPLDNCTFLWKRFASAGYRTLYAEDTPHISTFNYVKTGFHHQPTDYYFRPFIMAYEEELGRDKRMNCHLCVGSVSETEAILHWNQQFAEHFKDKAYFSFSWINSLTHDFLNMGSSGDHMYEAFFRTLHQGGYLDRTIVIVMGDHGMRWGEIRKTYIGRLEERLPVLFIALPEKFKREHPAETHELLLNSHRLVTPFDLHATLVNMLQLQPGWKFSNPDNVSEELSRNFTRRALSLLQPVPEDRSCDDAFIEEHWCTCETSLPMDTDNDDVKEIAEFLVISINNLLSPVSGSCGKLRLKKISDARLWQPASEHEGHTAEDSVYTVVIQTAPSDAVFEGTAKLSPDEDDPQLLGTISRLNLYGNQSSCVDDAKYKKYCYCS